MSPSPPQSHGRDEPSNAALRDLMEEHYTRIVGRLDQVDNEQRRQCEQITTIEDALLGTIKPPRQGFLNRVRDLEKKVGVFTKIASAAAVAAAGAAGAWVWSKVTGSPH